MATFPVVFEQNPQDVLLLSLLEQIKKQQTQSKQPLFNSMEALERRKAERNAALRQPMTPIIQNVFNRGGGSSQRSPQDLLSSTLSSIGGLFGKQQPNEGGENIQEQQQFPFPVPGGPKGGPIGLPDFGNMNDEDWIRLASSGGTTQSPLGTESTVEAYKFAKDNPEVTSAIVQILLAMGGGV